MLSIAGPNSPMAMEPGEWGEWSECSVTCGGGMQSAVRECYEGETDPALHCPVPTLRTRRCREQPCPSMNISVVKLYAMIVNVYLQCSFVPLSSPVPQLQSICKKSGMREGWGTRLLPV